MLAQYFKTPADLQITDAEFEALVKVLGMLERGELKHGRFDKIATKPLFSMRGWGHSDHCGTIGCIAGWARVVSGGAAFPWARSGVRASSLSDGYRAVPIELKATFAPMGIHMWDNITPAQAAMALRSYLTTGEARWDEALAS